MYKRRSGLRLVFAVMALAALSAVMAAACGGAEDEEAKDVAPSATQAVVQASTAAPADVLSLKVVHVPGNGFLQVLHSVAGVDDALHLEPPVGRLRTCRVRQLG